LLTLLGPHNIHHGHRIRVNINRNKYDGRPEEKKPLGTPRRRWEDNIKMDLQEVVGGRVVRGYWMELAQDRDKWWALLGTVRNFRFHKCREFLD
jgi:hypothetical protein